MAYVPCQSWLGVSERTCPMERLVTNLGRGLEIAVMSARKWAAGEIIALILAAGWIATGHAPGAWALQPEVPGPRTEGERANNGISRAAVGQTAFVPAQRSMLLLLDRAQRLLDESRDGEAAQCLGAILDSPDDYFFRPDASLPVHRSLKAEARRMVGRMTKKGRELYELEFGSIAARMLDEAVTAGDVDGLAEVSRRFFHTRAGNEATFLLGFHHLDHGRPMAGALTFKRLWESSPNADQYEPALSLALAACWLQASEPEKARGVLEGLESGQPGGAVQIAGEEVALDSHKGGLASWLAEIIGPAPVSDGSRGDQWSMLRGDASRNAAGGGGGPLLTMRWRIPTTDDPEVESLIEDLRRDYAQEDMQLIPAFHPLVVDDVLLMRTVSKLQAVDFKTGKRIWEVPTEDPFDESLDSAGNVASGRRTLLESSLRLRMWGDAAYGTLGSDGKYVFAVEDLKLEDGMGIRRQFVVNPMRPADAASLKPSNRLAAYEIRTGKLMWQVGGAANEHELRLGGTFFLGPPLPLMGDLYVLAELNGEIRLLALDSGSGDLLWDQQLTVVNRDVLNDPVRRLAGASPSYADGILVCPTSDKSVVALELTTRSLLWGYIHSTSDSQPRRQGMFMAPGQFPSADTGGRWIDSSVVLAEGRVLVTPVRSDELHCLDLADGRLAWTQSRNDDLFLACAYDGKAVLVGRRGVRALALNDGSVAWEKGSVEFPEGSSLTGTGFRSGNRYYVPLDTATVAAIDLDTGRLAETFESRERAVPGNLVCYKDKIVSQRADGVEAFHQLDLLREEVKKRLAAEPDGAEALTWAGEIMWNDGNLREAVESFRAAWKLSPSIYTRRAFREALFEGLRGEFESYRGRLEEIRPLIDDVSQQATLLRLVAMGLEDAGEYAEALDCYRELIELDHDGQRMEPIDEWLALRRDRWIRVQMSALRRKMPEESRDEIDRFARDLLDVAIGERTPEAIRGFLDYFDGQPVAREARDILGGLLKQNGRLLEQELLLERDAGSSDPERAGRAIAEMAAILAGADRLGDAAVCYKRLAEDFADVICGDGKTGKELYRAVEAGDPVSAWLAPESPWPVGNVESKEGIPKPTGETSYGKMVVNYQGGSGPFFRDLSIEIHQTPLQLVARDGLGNIRWHLPLDTITPREHLAYGRAMMQVNVLGHMLLLSAGNKILAIDTLNASEGQTPSVVWTQDLHLPDAADIRRQQFRRMANLRGGLGGIGIGGGMYPTANGPVAVSSEAVCFKRSRTLVAVDPVSGEEIWTRRDVHPDSVVFGDHEYVFVAGPDKTEADVFRVADGKLLGKRSLPTEIERITTAGRRVLTWRVEGPGATVRLIDPWEEGTPKHSVWVSDELDSNSRMFVLDDEAVAVYEPSGRFVMLDLIDGHPIVDQQLPPENLAEIFVLRCPDQYLLIAHAQQLAAITARTTYTHGVPSVRIERGQVHAFDLSGKKMWPEPVEVTNQFLVLNQPRSLPVLTFVCMIQEPQAGNIRTQPKTAILCLDKRTGRVICSKEFADPTSVFQLSGDPEKKTVGIRLQKNMLTLTFTDQPIPPKEDSDEGGGPAEEEDPSVIETLLEAVKKAVLGPAGSKTEPTSSDHPEMVDEPSGDADRPSAMAKETAAESEAEGQEGGVKEESNGKPDVSPAPKSKEE